MSMNVSTSQAQGIQSQTDIEPGPNPTSNQSRNSVGDHAPVQQTGTGSLNDGAREATTNKPLGRKEIEALTEERLMEDPDYRELKAKLESCEGLEEKFHLIDKHVGFRDNSTITLDDILALVNDTNADPTLREAAKWFNDNRGVLAALKKDDNLIGLHDVKNFIAGMRAQAKEMKDAARAEIKSENGVGNGPTATNNNGATATNTAGATSSDKTPAQLQKEAEAKAIMADANNSLPKPAPSQFSGLEGASENLNNMLGWAEAETDRLTELMGKTDDPAALKQLEVKINQMSRRMQQMTALTNQIMTAMQNISKMYSDIAMNSVRNMK